MTTKKSKLENMADLNITTKAGVMTVTMDKQSPSGAYVNFPSFTNNVLVGYGRMSKIHSNDSTRLDQIQLDTFSTDLRSLDERMPNGEYTLVFIPGAKEQFPDGAKKSERDTRLYGTITTILDDYKSEIATGDEVMLDKSVKVALNDLGSKQLGYTQKILGLYRP